MSDPVAAVRRFNRSYTQRIGVLEDSYLGLGMPLGPARLLFEIGQAGSGQPRGGHGRGGHSSGGPDPAEALTTQALRGRLGLDSGYLSRLLRRLERDGLVAVRTDPADRRRRQVS